MGRLLALAVVVLALLVPVSASQAVDPCAEGDPPSQPASGTVDISPQPAVVNHPALITGNFAESRPYVDGSMQVQVQQPDGTIVTFSADTQGYTPKQVGQHVATVTAKYYGCNRADGQTEIVTDTAGPTPFDVIAGRDPTMFIKAIVRRSHGSGKGSAFLQANVECGDSSVATGLPVTFTIYYETTGRLPGHSSPHIASTAAHGCQGRSSKDTRASRRKRLYTIETDPGGAQLNVIEPQRMRVLIELTRGTKVLGASRASFKRGAPGEAVVRDSGSCAGAPKGCQRFKTTFI